MASTETEKAIARRYYARHRHEILERAHLGRLANPTKFKEREARWDAAHRDQRNESARLRRLADLTMARAKDRSNRQKHRVRRLANLREWHQRNPGMNALYIARRNARLMQTPGDHTNKEWLDKCALLGNVCLYCGEAKPLTRDHKVPLARGGSNDISNIVPACLSCNSSKHMRTAREFLGLAA